MNARIRFHRGALALALLCSLAPVHSAVAQAPPPLPPGPPAPGATSLHTVPPAPGSLQPPLPVLKSLSVTQVFVGSPDLKLKLEGFNMTSSDVVALNAAHRNYLLRPTAAGEVFMNVIVPAATFTRPGVVTVTVTDANLLGRSSNALTFTIVNAPAKRAPPDGPG